MARSTRLVDFEPVWQFGERHTIRVHAPPDRVFDALRGVTAAEITPFRTLTLRGGRSLLSTETCLCNDGAARRRFAVYWRLILPGSALIRMMWLRAVKRRAEQPMPPTTFGNRRRVML